MHAIEHRQYAILQLLLLDPRVELNVENNVGQTPLHFAVSKEDYLSVQILVQDQRVNVNYPNFGGDTPLLLAARKFSDHNSTRLVESLLLSSDLNVNYQDFNGRTALWHANGLKLNTADRWDVAPIACAAEAPFFSAAYLLLQQPGIQLNAQSRRVIPPLW
ncbi:uncharacterized protein N7483_002428 [Penicillium malachiteum]|uniref:uncharacterized protein n=1 Tax=Penicillium malachiteum TaxID=1324776 RepID=UPI0025498FA3|nr:uncharacterized protein N7483_002428 [Penicillium malachiteum]KAJ5737303.1 hypothetical protein N7483_002428 [Penicillium malachiteum]